MIWRSISGKLWLAMTALVVVTVFLLGTGLSRVLTDLSFNRRADELTESGLRLAQRIAASRNQDEIDAEVVLLSDFLRAKIMVVDRNGVVSYCSRMGMQRGMAFHLGSFAEVLKGKVVIQQGQTAFADTTVLTVAVPIKKSQVVDGGVFLFTPVFPLNEAAGHIQRVIYFGAGAAILVAALLSLLLSKTMVRSLVQMNRVAQAMGRGDFQQRVKINTRDEVGTLGETLNHLSSQLEQHIVALSREKAKLSNILSSMSDGVVTFDGSGEVVMVNPPAMRLLNANLEEGLNAVQLPPDLVEMYRAVMERNQNIQGDVQMDERYLAARLSPLRGKEGEVGGTVAVLQDITGERRLEMMRREFVANVSHELRTPLTFLQGYSEALLDGMAKDEEQQRRYLKIILVETHRLRRLVNDLLDLTRFENGSLHLEIRSIDLPALITAVIEKMSGVAADGNVVLTANLPGPAEIIALGDPDRLEQVLINLVDNALRHTPAGGRVEVRLTGRPTEFLVEIEDNGQGIASEELSLIWERFYKGDKARTTSEGGTGLGLAIVKKIIEAHGGTVGATSTLGQGSRFYFTIPLK